MLTFSYINSDIATIVTAVATICGLFLIYFQVRVAVRSFEHDHARRRKKATFDMYNSLREKIREGDLFFRTRFGNTLSDADVAEITNDEALKARMVELLGILERISVGAKNDIYDINILNELSGTVFIKMYARYETYIQSARKKSETYFTAYEWLTKEIYRLREPA